MPFNRNKIWWISLPDVYSSFLAVQCHVRKAILLELLVVPRFLRNAISTQGISLAYLIIIQLNLVYGLRRSLKMTLFMRKKAVIAWKIERRNSLGNEKRNISIDYLRLRSTITKEALITGFSRYTCAWRKISLKKKNEVVQIKRIDPAYSVISNEKKAMITQKIQYAAFRLFALDL